MSNQYNYKSMNDLFKGIWAVLLGCVIGLHSLLAASMYDWIGLFVACAKAFVVAGAAMGGKNAYLKTEKYIAKKYQDYKSKSNKP